jgi:uncharacterized Fe-S cluster-containing protein
LTEELVTLRSKITTASDECSKLEREILEVQSFLEKVKESNEDMTDEEITNLLTQITSIEERTERNDFFIGEVERVVDAKKQRFAEMDLFAKYTRRSKELAKLKSIVDERDKIVKDLMEDCKEDLADEKAADDLKHTCELVLVDSE